MVQIHKEFTNSQVKELVERYLRKEIERKYIQEVLGIGKTRFFALVKAYRKDPDKFSIQYTRNIQTRKISQGIVGNGSNLLLAHVLFFFLNKCHSKK